MATYTVTDGSIGSPAFALNAGQLSTVTFTEDLLSVEVVSDGAAPIWWRCDGGTPAIDGQGSYYLPMSGVDQRQPSSSGPTVVKLLSAGTPTVRVQRGDA